MKESSFAYSKDPGRKDALSKAFDSTARKRNNDSRPDGRTRNIRGTGSQINRGSAYGYVTNLKPGPNYNLSYEGVGNGIRPNPKNGQPDPDEEGMYLRKIKQKKR